MNRLVKLLLVGIVAVFTVSAFTGCSAMHTAVKKRNLDVQTKMSDTVFLDPVKPSDRIIYVSVRNTTGQKMVIKNVIKNLLMQNGYKITDNPEEAKFMLQANVLKLEKTDLRTVNAYKNSAYGAALTGGAAGAAMGSMVGAGHGYNGKGALVGALAGAALSTIGDAMIDDTYYVMVTDLQMRERPRNGEVITQSQTTNAKQGTSTSLNQQVQGGKIEWKTYRTRIISTANKVNLKFQEAKPKLEDELINSIAGIFVEA